MLPLQSVTFRSANTPGFHMLPALLYLECQIVNAKDSSQRLFSLPCPSFCFHGFISVTDSCLSPLCMLMAGLPEFASHGSSLHQAAGCQ